MGIAILWVLVGVTIYYAHSSGRTLREELTVERVDIEITDSTSHGQLVTREMVLGWLRSAKVKLQGEAGSKVNLQELEQIVSSNGFVGRVTAYVGLDGVLKIEIGQREPLFRLLVDGYNHYVTRDGYIFKAPPTSALYVPLVTGSYKPPFLSRFEGYIADNLAKSEEEYRERDMALEREKYPLYTLDEENRKYYRETRKMFISQGLFERREHFLDRVDSLKKLKRERHRRYRYRKQQIELGIGRVESKQEALKEEQKKLQKSYEDFQKLITFVEEIQKDDFWRSEMVQIVASKANSGALEVEFVPRSGNYTVALGRLELVDDKLERLKRFTEEILQRDGWEWFSLIDLRYEERVICSKKR